MKKKKADWIISQLRFFFLSLCQRWHWAAQFSIVFRLKMYDAGSSFHKIYFAPFSCPLSLALFHTYKHSHTQLLSRITCSIHFIVYSQSTYIALVHLCCAGCSAARQSYAIAHCNAMGRWVQTSLGHMIRNNNMFNLIYICIMKHAMRRGNRWSSSKRTTRRQSSFIQFRKKKLLYTTWSLCNWFFCCTSFESVMEWENERWTQQIKRLIVS